MERLSVLLAQTMRIVQVRGMFGYLPEAVNALVKNYGFVGYPREAELAAILVAPDSNATAKPAVFTQGKAPIDGRTLVIDRLEIYNNGIVANTHTDTNDSDLIVADVLRWSSERFKVTYDEIKPSAGHSSQLEIRFARPLPELMPALAPVGKRISDSLEKDFWGFEPAYHVVGVNFYFDKNKYPAFAPSVVRIDYRAGQPFERNVYWSEAPLATADHEAVLTEFENACLKAIK